MGLLASGCIADPGANERSQESENAIKVAAPASPGTVSTGGGPACRRLEVTASKVYSPPRYTDGEATVTPPFRFVLPSEIPVIEGNAGNHSLTLRFRKKGSSDLVGCVYDGGAKQGHPTKPDERVKGLRYVFSRCDDRSAAGQIIAATLVHLHVDNGDLQAGRTTARLALDEPAPCRGDAQDASDGSADAGAKDAGDAEVDAGDRADADGEPDATPVDASDTDAWTDDEMDASDDADAAETAPPCIEALCDDGNACTRDACGAGNTCVHTPAATGTSCSDGNACNGAETCNGSGSCGAGAPPVIDDGNVCTSDTCDPTVGVTHGPVAVGTSCSDGDACNGAEICDATGACSAGAAPVIDDANACTRDACDPSTGPVHTPLDGASCSDGNACNGDERCTPTGACAAGTPVATDDGNPCTVDACDPVMGVMHVSAPVGVSCSDGNACNGAEGCNGTGLCAVGPPVLFDDGNPCTTDACDPASGVLHAPAETGTSCSDHNLCNGSETCNAAGACVPGAPLPVDDGDPCTEDACDAAVGVTHAPITTGTCSADPRYELGAPEGDHASAPRFVDATKFLYAGDAAPQLGVASGTISALRAAVVRGTVRSTSGVGRPGVRISVVAHPELGWTYSRGDGAFDLAVNGGGALTLRFTQAGAFEVQRDVDVPWRQYAFAADVVMTDLDLRVTAVQPETASTVQVVRGSEIHDASGARQATLMFLPGTHAGLRLPNGTSQPLTTLNVRATEFTMGPTGPAAMPAQLPPASAYTYCLEISVDEAISAGATAVEFSQPVVAYVDNFLGFPVGGAVPAGSYDRESGRWTAERNGRVIRVLSISAGRADIDANGDGVADGASALAAIGVTEGERESLAALYEPGKSLWRVAIGHLSPWDFNWPFGPPPGAGPPNPPTPKGGEKGPDEPEPECGSVIGCETQTLGESVPVAGTPFSLNYTSARVRGKKDTYTLSIPVTGATNPGPVKRVELEVFVAGQRMAQTLASEPNQLATVTWDGRDAYGRPVSSVEQAQIRIGYVYDGAYQSVTSPPGVVDYDRQFGHFTYFGAPIGADQMRREVTIYLERTARIGSMRVEPLGLPGWSISPHHVFSSAGSLLARGDGSQQTATGLARIVRRTLLRTTGTSFAAGSKGRDGGVVVALPGCRIERISPEGVHTLVAGTGVCKSFGPQPTGPVASTPIGQAVMTAEAPDRTVYYSGSAYWDGVVRITPQGIVSQFVAPSPETTEAPPSWGLSANDPFGTRVSAVATGSDGQVYFADTMSYRGGIYEHGNIYRIVAIAPDGNRRTVLRAKVRNNVPPPANAGDDASALEAYVSSIDALAVGRDGNVYFAEMYANRVRRVSPDGFVRRVAGTGAMSSTGDGLPGTAATLHSPRRLAVGPTGELFICENGSWRVRAVGTNGFISTVIGQASAEATLPYDRETYTTTEISAACGQNLVVNGSGDVCTQPANGRNELSGDLYCRSSVLPEFSTGESVIADDDGQVIHVFDADGRHLRTAEVKTGAVTARFAYDALGHLVGITDVNGNATTLAYTSTGIPSRVIGTYGDETHLDVDAGGNLARVRRADGTSLMFTYHPDSLLASKKDAGGDLHSFEYDGVGRLVRDANPVGYRTLARTEHQSGWDVAVTTAMGRKRRYAVDETASGIDRTMSVAPGESTLSRIGANATHVLSLPDGTVINSLMRDEPTFGAMAPIAATESVRLPSGLTSSVTRSMTLTGGDILETTVANGKTYKRSWTQLTRRTTLTSPAGRKIDVDLDAKGRTVRLASAGLSPVTLTYDARGRVAAVAMDTRSYGATYGANGRMSSVTDTLGRATTFEYDVVGRRTKQTFPGGRAVSATYDSDGTVTSLTTPSGNTHIFAPVAGHLLGSYIPPAAADSGATLTLFSYDQDKQPASKTLPDGSRIDLAYDAAGRLAAVTSPLGVSSFRYGASGLLSGSTTHDGVVLSYAYDGSLGTGITWSGVLSGKVERTFDANLRLTTETVNGGSAVTYQYDADGLVTAAGAETVTRDAQTGFIRGTLLGDVTDTLAYQAFGELSAYTSAYQAAPLYGAQYARDALGRVISVSESVQGVTQTLAFEYDTGDRLKIVKVNGAQTESYAYDANGNRTSKVTSAGTEVGSYDAQDRMSTYAGAEYGYTANGELRTKTVDGTTTLYAYDLFGNLRNATLPGGELIDYVIDGQHRRIGKKVSGALVQGFLYRNALKPAAELDGAGNVVSRFVYGTRRHVPDYLVKAGATYRIVSDYVGSPRLVIDVATGQVAQRMDFDVWGNVTRDTAPGFQPFGFAGGIYDRDTQLTRFGARDYDPRTGRWVTKDPTGFWDGMNLYAYVRGDPVNLIDISGSFATATRTGNSVSIEIPITWYGPDATPENIARVIKAIESKWSGKVGKFDVKVRVRTVPKPASYTSQCPPVPVNNVKLDYFKSARSSTVTGHGLNGDWDLARPDWTFAHEAGHLMMLPDQGPGANTIMESGALIRGATPGPTQATIEAILKSNPASTVEW